MVIKQTITNWKIFYNRKLNQAQWRSLKNGPMRLKHPENKHFKKVRDLFIMSKEFLEKYARRSKQYEMEGKDGVKKLINHNLSWFTIVCFMEACTLKPLREEPKDSTELPKKPDPPLSTKTHRVVENKEGV